MDRMAFLLNMYMSGIKNIEDEIKIEFYGKNVNKNFSVDKNNIKGIYGENGSGKTAIITAVNIVREFIYNPNYLRESQNGILLRELINKNKREFSFKCEFVTHIELFLIIEYEVCFSFDNNDEIYVSYESLKYKANNSKNKQKVFFVCKDGDFVELELEDDLKKEAVEKTRNLLYKQSALYPLFLALGKKTDNNEVAWLILSSAIFFLVVRVYFDREDRHTDYFYKKRINELKDGLSSDELVNELIKGIPTNARKVPINEFQNYENKIRRLETFIKLFKPDLKSIDIETKEDRDYYECELLMNYGSYRVNREFESTGIKKIIELFDAFEQASNGQIVFIDEMDSNINDVYLCKLIEYFTYYGEGQLCFTSHNTNPMSILKENNKSIDFITRNNGIVPWVKNGHYTPENSYKNGMIEGMPYNIDSSDFINVFERGE